MIRLDSGLKLLSLPLHIHPLCTIAGDVFAEEKYHLARVFLALSCGSAPSIPIRRYNALTSGACRPCPHLFPC